MVPGAMTRLNACQVNPSCGGDSYTAPKFHKTEMGEKGGNQWLIKVSAHGIDIDQNEYRHNQHKKTTLRLH